MSNIAAMLKEEIARIARREVRGEVEALKKAQMHNRAQTTELKREVARLQKEVTRLVKANGQSTPVAEEIEVANIRWSPAKLKRHRERLELSAERFGKLFDVSGQTIYNWEGGTRPGKDQLIIISQLRKLSKRQALALIEEKGRGQRPG